MEGKSVLDFVFESSDNLRHENGKHFSDPHSGARRAIKVEPIRRGSGYIVTMFYMDGVHPLWQNNVQKAPKRMGIIGETPDKVIQRGFGQDALGASFADYGLTIHLSGGKVAKCSLHMYDRGVDIEYLP